MKINQKRLKQLEKMKYDKLLDELAKIEHKQWKKLATFLICHENISASRREKWFQLFDTEWINFDDPTKDADREFAKIVLNFIGVFEK